MRTLDELKEEIRVLNAVKGIDPPIELIDEIIAACEATEGKRIGEFSEQDIKKYPFLLHFIEIKNAPIPPEPLN